MVHKLYRFGSWNVRGKGVTRLGDWLSLYPNGFDMLGVQEVGCHIPPANADGSLAFIEASEDSELSDYHILGTSSCDSHSGNVILLDRQSVKFISESWHGKRYAAVRFTLDSGCEVVFVNVHFPHKDRPDSEFELACAEVNHILTKFSSTAVIIAGDFNCEWSNHQDDRGAALQAELASFGVCCKHPESKTWHGRVSSRTYDYFIFNDKMKSLLVDVDYGDDTDVVQGSHTELPSDRDLVFFSVLMCAKSNPKKLRTQVWHRRRCRKWVVDSAQLKQLVDDTHEAFVQDYTLSQQWQALCTMSSKASIPRRSCKYVDPPHVKELCKRRRKSVADERSRLTKEILTQRHLARLHWWSTLESQAASGEFGAIDYVRKRQNPKPSTTCFVTQAGGAEAAAKQVKDHFSEVFVRSRDPAEDEAVEDCLRKFNDLCNPSNCVPFTIEEIQNAVHTLKLNKTAGLTGMSNEFLQCLAQSTEGVNMLQDFLAVLLQRGAHDIGALKQCVVALIPKLQTVCGPQDLRPICLLETMNKLFCKLLVTRLLDVWPKPKHQYGGLPGGQLLDALLGVHAFLERESLQGAPCIYVSLDIRKAFDSVGYSHLLRHIQAVTPASHAPEARRLCEMLLHPTLNFEFEGQQWQLEANVGVQQGGSHSSTVFSHYFDTVISHVFQSQTDCNMHDIPGWLFVDDCLVIYGNWKQAHQAFSYLCDRLQAVGLHLNFDKTVVFSTSQVLAEGERTVPQSSPLRQCKWANQAKYLRKTVSHFDALNPQAEDLNDNMVGFSRRAVYQGLDSMASITKKLNWNQSVACLNVLYKYVHSKWLWISPLIQPLQKHIDRIRKLQNDAAIAVLKLYIPAWLGSSAAMPLNLLRRRTAALLHHLDARAGVVKGWIMRKWNYVGHLLRMKEDTMPSIALRHGAPGLWHQVRPGPRNMLFQWVHHVVIATGLCVSNGGPSWHELRELAADRHLWASHQQAVADLYCQTPHYAKTSTDWVKWRHALTHECHWGLCLFVHWSPESVTAIWLDVTEGWQSLSVGSASDIFHILEVVLRYLRYVGSWLSFQVLLPQDTFELFEHTLYDVTSKLYAKYQKVVSYQVVPEAWSREVATLASQS